MATFPRRRSGATLRPHELRPGGGREWEEDEEDGLTAIDADAPFRYIELRGSLESRQWCVTWMETTRFKIEEPPVLEGVSATHEPHEAAHAEPSFHQE